MTPIKATDRDSQEYFAPLIKDIRKERLALYLMKTLGYPPSKANRLAGL